MRKTLEGLSVLALILIVAITVSAVWGPNRLPNRVPTHFDGEGQPTGYSTPESLLGLPLAAIVLYGLMTTVSRRPGAFNFPTRVTPMNRPRLEALAVQMIAWLKVEVMFLFAWIQHFTIEAARSAHGALPAGFMPVTLCVIIGTIIVYFVMFRRVTAY